MNIIRVKTELKQFATPLARWYSFYQGRRKPIYQQTKRFQSVGKCYVCWLKCY